MNPSDAIEAIEKPLSSLPYSLSRHILEHLRKLTSHEPVRKRLARTVLIFTEKSDQLSRATDRVPGLPASPGYAQ
ncbi:putative GTP-binding protein [Escherichia coli]|uniref:Putative GTP-binding protein n=1 Tax=Escherichia coli TaxID=562 RepID=A0A376P8B2_ECOLX|nr:putative GTP-binding protein [Escherichia coli]STH74601.1 putative GTP-binding protein [Escherichia coli]